MRSNTLVSRRRVVVTAVGLTSACAIGSLAGCQAKSAGTDRPISFMTLDEALADLKGLEAAAKLESSAKWSWVQTLEHCSQSIEYSMQGFPEPKSAIFQRTVGSAAYSYFAWKGKMTHDLAEPIPGAPALSPNVAPVASLSRLRSLIAAFQTWSGPLKPHFAYGELDKKQYEHAHAMHLASHFAQFRALS